MNSIFMWGFQAKAHTNRNGATSMAIGRDEIFAAADVLKAKGVKVSNSSLKAELYSVYESGGNRNLVCECFREWRKINDVKTNNVKPPKQPVIVSHPPATTKTVTPVQADTAGDSNINKLPESVRTHVINLVKAILTLIGIIRKQERDAATELAEHAESEVHQQVIELKNKISQLSEENEKLQAALAAKQVTVSADTILAVFTKLLAINAPALNLVTTPLERPVADTTTPEMVVVKKPTKIIKKKKP
jgi:hypothetical protein